MHVAVNVKLNMMCHTTYTHNVTKHYRQSMLREMQTEQNREWNAHDYEIT